MPGWYAMVMLSAPPPDPPPQPPSSSVTRKISTPAIPTRDPLLDASDTNTEKPPMPTLLSPYKLCFFLRTGLHAPLDYGPPLYPGEDHVKGDSDERYSHQAREHVWYPQEVAGVVYEVAQTPASSGDAEDQLGRDDRAPPEGPAGFEPANRVRQRRRHQHVLDQLEASQPQIASYHEDGGINGAEARAHVDRYGPRYRVGNDEDERRRAQAEPEYGERQDRDRRQRVEHRS